MNPTTITCVFNYSHSLQAKAAEPSLHIRFKKLVVRHNGLLASLRRVRGK
jgi:hypothetical protein